MLVKVRVCSFMAVAESELMYLPVIGFDSRKQ